jgi:O-antigen/teichoic acid export membrane protein
MTQRVTRNAIYNALGLISPIVAALFAIPVLIGELGVDRFGLLTLIWAIVNYFGIFDLGLGRALTLRLAVLAARGQEEESKELLVTTLAALALLGVVGSMVLLMISGFSLVSVSTTVSESELRGSVFAMAVAMPLVTLTSGARGALEARSAFGVLNAIRVPMGLLSFALPVVIARYGSGELDDIAWSLTVARAIGLVTHLYFTRVNFPSLRDDASIRWSSLTSLFYHGSWMTVSNVVSPVMGYMDRFIVGMLISGAFVAYYATPQELILKVYLIPGALTAVLFPIFAADPRGSESLYRKSLFFTVAFVVPACAVGILASKLALTVWVNEVFAGQSYVAMQILLAGVAFGAISAIPYTRLQAIGHSKITAVSHLFQLPVFLSASYLLTSLWGIEGAAIAWSGRLAVDAIILFVAVSRCSPK